MAKQYEYEFVLAPIYGFGQEVEDAVNELGRDGYRLFSIAYADRPAQNNLVFVMEREKETE